MTDPATQLATLRALRATISDPAQAAALDAVIAGLEAQQQATQIITGQAHVGVAVAGNLHGNVYLDGRRADAARELLAGYLARLRGRCASMPLEGVRQQKQASDVLAISLDQVYTQMTVPGSEQREVFSGAALRTFDLDAYLQDHTGGDVLPWERRTRLHRPLTQEEQDTARDDARRMQKQIAPDFAGIDPSIPDGMVHHLASIDRDELRQIISQVDQLAFVGPRLVTDAIAAEPRLVLLGEPGSGKSTVLRYLALTLAEAALDVAIDLPARLAGWERLGAQQRLLPVFLPLLPFAQQLVKERTQQASADDLWRYIADQLEPGEVRTGLAEAVHAELTAGRVLLLLDGLDEVAGAESRRQVVRAVEQFGREYTQCRLVVSCRVRAYEGEQNRAWQLAGWATTTLEPWDHVQMHHFVAAWYAAAVAAGGLPEAQRADRVAALQRAIAASTDLQRLADRPLLLTIMALVHLNDGRLPEDRVALYGRCVDILLGQWELRGKEYSAYGALMDYLGLPDRDVQRLRPLLTRAAFKAHEAGTADSPGVLGRETLRLMAGDHLAQLGHPDPYRGALRFLDYTDQRAGLIQATAAGDAYAFPHLTFQEYLAGLELTSGVGVVQRIMQHRRNDRWRVPILLGIGDYVSGNKLELPYQLLRELLDAEDGSDEQRQRDAVFAAEIAADVGWERLEQGGATFNTKSARILAHRGGSGAANPPPNFLFLVLRPGEAGAQHQKTKVIKRSWYKKLRRDLAQALAQIVEGTALPAAERVRAGVLLGSLGDPRPSVCSLPPAMVPLAGGSIVLGILEEEVAEVYEGWLAYWREAGGSEKAEEYARSLTDIQKNTTGAFCALAPFELARYPVTNAQYACFMADDGYNPDTPWWDDAGRAWLARDDAATNDLQSYQRREHKQQPKFWNNERFGLSRPNQPVVGVSWYEAMAFCRWLTQSRQYNPDGHSYALPSEAEWEFAARSTERRTYPWGTEEPDTERANFQSTYRGTTAVGCFSEDAPPEGVLELAGNVREWTRSEYRDYPYDSADGREETTESARKQFTLRGGSWSNDSLYLRASSRGLSTPDSQNFFIGFRLARHQKV